MARRSGLVPLTMLGIWFVGTLFWWGLAFAPTFGPSPDWLSAARGACFGTMENGLPGTSGWMLLILGPLSFLVAFLVGWREEVFRDLKNLAVHPLGRSVILVSLALVVVEGAWVFQAVSRGLEVVRMDFRSQDLDDLPENYPRLHQAAPDFSLVDQSGSTVGLEQFRGEVVLLTFAFAHCQTVCPMIVVQSVEALQEISDEGTHLLIVTLDPWRDTPGSLPSLAKRWELPQRAHLLSGPVESVTKTLDLYEVAWVRDETNGDVSHPALTYVISPEGEIAYRFNNASPKWLVQASARLRELKIASEGN